MSSVRLWAWVGVCLAFQMYSLWVSSCFSIFLPLSNIMQGIRIGNAKLALVIINTLFCLFCVKEFNSDVLQWNNKNIVKVSRFETKQFCYQVIPKVSLFTTITGRILEHTTCQTLRRMGYNSSNELMLASGTTVSQEHESVATASRGTLNNWRL